MVFNTQENEAQIAQIDLTGLKTKKRNCDISNTLNAVAASQFQDPFFFFVFFFFVKFDTRDLEVFLICQIESVDPVDDLCLTSQIYSVLLNAFEFKEVTEVQNAHLKMLFEDDET